MIIEKTIVTSQIRRAEIHQILNIQFECGLSGWTADEYEEELKREDSLMFVAKHKDETVGFIAARLSWEKRPTDEPVEHTELDILNIGVVKKFQRQGIGTILFEYLINKISQNNPRSVGTVWLEVRQSNLNAINFYRKKGFSEIQIRKNFYRQPLENAILMKMDV